jgi:hypothetical protein
MSKSTELNFEPNRQPQNLPLLRFTLIACLCLLVLGAGLRLLDLTDQPIDFHPTRQLRGAIIARGMYYEMLPSANETARQEAMAFWASTGQYEPSILERLVAVSYLIIGREIPWLARIYNTLFWLIGGIALFDLARRMNLSSATSHETRGVISAGEIGALVAVAYYLVLPFSVQASRSFQPDPSMVVWLILSAWTAFIWSENPSWKWAVLAGIFSGLAVLTKAISFYTVAGLLFFLTLHTFWKNQHRTLLSALGSMLRSPQVIVIALITVSPTLIYYLSRGGRASEYFSSWTLALAHLLLQPVTYLRWLNLIQQLLNPVALLLAFIGVLLSQGRSRFLLLGMWLGYVAYGLFLPYQMTSHSYYHLQLVALVAISIAPVASRLVAWLITRSRIWQYIAMAAAFAWLAYWSWQALIPLYSQDYRNEPAYWQEIASYLPENGKIIALTQDYGYRLMYYGWRKVVLWPNRGEMRLNVLRGSEKDFRDFFAKRIDGKSYFLITAFKQFDDQPALKETLYGNFPILAQGSGYVIFDLVNTGQLESEQGSVNLATECHPFR